MINRKKIEDFAKLLNVELGDEKTVDLIIKGLNKYNGNCPCVIASFHNEDTLCPCKDMRTTKVCKCKLFKVVD